METFLNIINCCKKDEILQNQMKSEIKVPTDNQQIKYKKTQKIQLSPENNEINESSNIKSSAHEVVG